MKLRATLTVLGLTACAGRGRAAPEASAPPEMAEGAALLQRTCTVCHDLGGLDAFAQYWGEPEWRSLVQTMMGYGAQLTPAEFVLLTRYLGLRY